MEKHPDDTYLDAAWRLHDEVMRLTALLDRHVPGYRLFRRLRRWLGTCPKGRPRRMMMTETPGAPPTPRPTSPLPADAVRVLIAAIEDMDLKMTPYHDEAGEWIVSYIVPCGPWHRILGLVRGGLWPEYVEERLTPPTADTGERRCDCPTG